jgi:hypothetical protein
MKFLHRISSNKQEEEEKTGQRMYKVYMPSSFLRKSWAYEPTVVA